MNTNRVVVERRGHVLAMGLNRADKRNAFDQRMFKELSAAYGLLERDSELRCGFLYGVGDHFTGGLELTDWVNVFTNGQWPEVGEGELDPMGLDEKRRVSKPVVMAVQGICFTIGIELMLAADIRICSEGTRFGQIEVKRGLYPVGGATLRMVQEFGWGNAQRYLLTGDEFGAQEAYRIGLVQEVVSAATPYVRGLEIAEKVAAQAPLAVYASLKSSRIAVNDGPLEAIRRMMPDLVPVMKSEDMKEGVQSFVERRQAHFKGR